EIIPFCCRFLALIPHSSKSSLFAAASIDSPCSTLPPKPFHFPAPNPLFFIPKSTLSSLIKNSTVCNTFFFGLKRGESNFLLGLFMFFLELELQEFSFYRLLTEPATNDIEIQSSLDTLQPML